MVQAAKDKIDPVDIAEQIVMRLHEALLITIWAIALFTFVALVTYDAADPAWSHTGVHEQVVNKGGVAGAWLADVLTYCLGYMAYIAPFVIAYVGWLTYRGLRDYGINYFSLSVRMLGFVLLVGAGCSLLRLHHQANIRASGILGDSVGMTLLSLFNGWGATLLMLALLATGLSLFTGISWIRLVEVTGRYTLTVIAFVHNEIRLGWQRIHAWFAELFDHGTLAEPGFDREPAFAADLVPDVDPDFEMEPGTDFTPPDAEPRPTAKVIRLQVKERKKPAPSSALFKKPPDSTLPPLSLLDEPPDRVGGYSKSHLQSMSRQVEVKLKDFGVEVEVVAVQPGPVITRFELQPAAGVKASRITNLSKDLARSLSTTSVRVVEVIPGKTVVGLEIPNEKRELVALSEILSSEEHEGAGSNLTMALGKDIGGDPMSADLARMPHLLVAGTTGAGKSVALNAMILSLLYRAKPADVRLIMIDPKMLELSVYEGIPSLLAPVVTDMKEAANALRWCVAEMERRYRLMSALGVRNMAGYNKKVKDAAAKGKPLFDPFAPPLPDGEPLPELTHLPHIVVIIDELADMMMTVGKKVEELIARLAQKARAAGLHLILATQRPSVDVITGLIKANIPSRIAFQVSSRVDSRTIIDQMGAENLLGHGDMLYVPPGTALPVRVHGAFVSDQEVHRVAEYLKSLGEPDYIDEILEGPAMEDESVIPGLEPAGEDADPLYDKAVYIVTETRRASISGVQRRLKIGYNRAARLIEEMERSGVVSAPENNGSRQVLAPPPPAD